MRVELLTMMRILPLVLAFLPVFALAGVDDMRVVTKISGKVEVSHFATPRRGLVNVVVWRQLKLGEVLGPNCQIRTGKDGDVWLQIGDQKDNPAKLPTDEIIYYEELRPNSLLRFYSQYLKGNHPKSLVYGKEILHKVRGRIPAAKFWGPQIYHPKGG